MSRSDGDGPGHGTRKATRPVLFGAITHDRPKKLEGGGWEIDKFNSATLVTPDGALQAPYDKMELLWFGETVPLGNIFGSPALPMGRARSRK